MAAVVATTPCVSMIVAGFRRDRTGQIRAVLTVSNAPLHSPLALPNERIPRRFRCLRAGKRLATHRPWDFSVRRNCQTSLPGVPSYRTSLRNRTLCTSPRSRNMVNKLEPP